jgi:hypothetical protein
MVPMDGHSDRIDATVSDLQATFQRELRAQTRAFVIAVNSVVLIMSSLCFALARFT